MQEPAVIKIALLGAWQHRRPGRFVREVAARTPHVFPSRAYLRARRCLRRELAAVLDEEPAREVELRLAGYSWGAWTLLHMIDALWERPTRWHPALSRERLRIVLGCLDPVDTFRRRVALPRDPRVEVYAVYQRNGCYRGCPGPSGWFAGDSIEGATENHDVTLAGRTQPTQDGVPPEHAPDHIQLGYTGFGDYDRAVADVLSTGSFRLPAAATLLAQP